MADEKTNPLSIDEDRPLEKRLPFFVRWFEWWKRDRQLQMLARSRRSSLGNGSHATNENRFQNLTNWQEVKGSTQAR
jgi:hypothetical protein